jgi:hypothetical protein
MFIYEVSYVSSYPQLFWYRTVCSKDYFSFPTYVAFLLLLLLLLIIIIIIIRQSYPCA